MKHQHLIDILIDHWLTEKEALTYISALELGLAPVSSIARHMWENRVTIYASIKNLIKKWAAKSTKKNWVTYYSVIAAEELVAKKKEKLMLFEWILPEFMALANTNQSHLKTQLYEWLEGVKTAYKKIILDGIAHWSDAEFLTFTWEEKIDQSLEKRLQTEFAPRRLQFPNKTRAILSSKNGSYALYTSKHHNTIHVDIPEFSFANEIVVYWEDKVAIILYATSEMTAMLIQSKALHMVMKGMFGYVWENYPAKRKAKTKTQ
jgi:hypothetical protein